MDSDLWKTLFNWSQIILDSKAGRDEESKQLAFVNKTSFLLASNKSENESNSFIKIATNFKQGDIKHKKLLEGIIEIKEQSSDRKIEKYIENVLKLPEYVSKAFFNNLAFDLGCDDLINKCKTSIREKQIDDTKIDDVFSSLDSKLRADNYLKVKSKEKIIISFDDFRRDYRLYFDRARNEKLPIRSLPVLLPEKLEKQTFIKQLIDIEDVQIAEIEIMAEYTTQRLRIRNNIDFWLKNGEITDEDIVAYENEAETLWYNRFRKAYKKDFSESEVNALAQGIIDDLRERKIPIASQELPMDMSNGSFYELSNKPTIGWRRDWKEKYS